MKEDYPKLFEPINIGNVELMNRVVFAPISTNFALENGRLTERFVKHYERRARGGVGLIIVEKFAYSARLAMDAGFDMVEIQGAHGLLVNQFLSPLTNHRDDEWGEPTRFAVEVRKRIAEKCGWDFPVTIRLAVDDFLEGGITLSTGREIALTLAKAGYDMIQADIGLGPKEKRLEPMYYPQAWRAYLAEKIRPLPVPVAAVGMIREPAVAEKVLETQAVTSG